MFGTWRIYDFPFSWEWNNIPTVTHSIIFQRGRYTTNQMNTWYYPYVNHGAGILTYKTGWFLGQMLVCIFQHHGSHMGYWDGAENSDSSFWLLEFAHLRVHQGTRGLTQIRWAFSSRWTWWWLLAQYFGTPLCHRRIRWWWCDVRIFWGHQRIVELSRTQKTQIQQDQTRSNEIMGTSWTFSIKSVMDIPWYSLSS